MFVGKSQMLRAGVDGHIFHVEDNLAAVGAQLVDEASRSDQVHVLGGHSDVGAKESM